MNFANAVSVSKANREIALEFEHIEYDSSDPEDITSFETVARIELPLNVGRDLLDQLNDFYSLDIA